VRVREREREGRSTIENYLFENSKKHKDPQHEPMNHKETDIIEKVKKN